MSESVSLGTGVDAQMVKHQLATRLRALRVERGWSLDRAAEETGVSKAMLGQIEREESSPTVASLWKIATGFQTPVSSFLAERPNTAAHTTFSRADSVRNKPASDNMLVAPLFPYDPQFSFELLELTLLPGYTRQSEPHAKGVTEHVVVLQGQMEVLIEGEWKVLHQGDAVRFAADRPHGYRNLNPENAIFHNLIHYPPNVG